MGSSVNAAVYAELQRRTASEKLMKKWNFPKEANPGFIDTSKNGRNNRLAVLALDCEMVTTEIGLEVAALTLVNLQGDVVYETLVKPEFRIIDYNTEYSWLIASMFRCVTTRLKDVHNKLLTLLGPNTILVGHALDNDLRVLRMVHRLVVDTSLVYTHPEGGRVKYSLKKLARKYLDTVDDSIETFKCREDAQIAMELVLRLLPRKLVTLA